MTDKRISEFAVRTLLGADLLEVVGEVGGSPTQFENYKVTLAELKTFVRDGLGTLALQHANNVTITGGTGVLTSLETPTINGGTAANDDITIQGTTHSTRTTSYVNLQPNGGNVGIGIAAPVGKVHVIGNTNANTADADNIVAGFANNLTQGFAIRFDGLYGTGSNTVVDLKFVAKGSTANAYFGNTSGIGLRVRWNDSINTIYNGANNIAITADSGRKLHLASSSGVAIGLTVDTTSGNVGIGTTTPGTDVLSVVGNIKASTRFDLPSYTVATLPAVGAGGGLIYVSNEAGGATPAFSNASNWKRVSDLATVS